MPRLSTYTTRAVVDITGNEYIWSEDTVDNRNYKFRLSDLVSTGDGSPAVIAHEATYDHTSFITIDDVQIYDQTLNTSDNVEFVDVNFTGTLYQNGTEFIGGGGVSTLSEIVSVELAAAPRKLWFVYGGEDVNTPGTPDTKVQESIDALLAAGVPAKNIRWKVEAVNPDFTIGTIISQSTQDVIVLTPATTFNLTDQISQSTQDSIVMTRTYGGVMTIGDATSQSTQDLIEMINQSSYPMTILDQTSQSTQDAISMTKTGGVMTIGDAISQSTQDNITLTQTSWGTFTIGDATSQSTQDAISMTKTGGVMTIGDAISQSTQDSITMIKQSDGTFTIGDATSQSTQDTIVMTIQNNNFTESFETESASGDSGYILSSSSFGVTRTLGANKTGFGSYGMRSIAMADSDVWICFEMPAGHNGGTFTAYGRRFSGGVPGTNDIYLYGNNNSTDPFSGTAALLDTINSPATDYTSQLSGTVTAAHTYVWVCAYADDDSVMDFDGIEFVEA